MPHTIVTFTEQNIRRILHLTPEPCRTRWRARIEDHGDDPDSWLMPLFPRTWASAKATAEEAVEATVERLQELPQIKRFKVERIEDPTE